MSGYTYILASQKNGTLYTGSTDDIVRRLEEHRSGAGSRFTSRHKVLRLVWLEPHDDIRDARDRERKIKAWRRDWKIALIEADNPDWRDLTHRFNL